jgi:hypothetical protein
MEYERMSAGGAYRNGWAVRTAMGLRCAPRQASSAHRDR